VKKSSDSVLVALDGGVDAARMALARRLARDVDNPKVPAYARAQLARVLADVLDRLAPDDGPPGIDARALLEEVLPNGHRK